VAAVGERLFLAVPLTGDVQRSLERRLPPDLPGKAVPAPNWHLTLRFLGDTPPELRDRLNEALNAAPIGGGFEIRFGGVGAFPRAERARVIWVGVSRGAERLAELGRAVEASCVAAGFPAEPKSFSAHLTITRLDPPAAVTGFLARVRPFEIAMPVARVVLYRSLLGNGPPRYEEVFSYPLRFA